MNTLPKRVKGEALSRENAAMEGLTVGEVAQLRRMREESNKVTDQWDDYDYLEPEVK